MILDTVTNAPRYIGLHPRIDTALRWLASANPADISALPAGRVDNLTPDADIFAVMQSYHTNAPETVVWEAHRQYIDVQVMVHGAERIGWRHLTPSLPVKSAYDESREAAFYDLPDDGAGFVLEAGHFAVFWPSDVHAPSLRTASDAATGSTVHKLVIKVPVSLA